MSDAASQQNTQQTTSGQPPTEPPHGSKGLWSVGFKLEQDAPVADHWKGKGIQEIIADAERMRTEAAEWRGLAMNAQQQTNYQQPAQQQAFSYQQQTGPQYPSAQLMLDNPQEYDRQMQAYIAYTNQQAAQSAVQQASAFITPQLTSTGRHLSQSGRYADAWNRWGSEIEREMLKSGLQPLQQTKDAWDMVAKFVMSEHIDELAREKAERMVSSGGFGTESPTNASAAPTAESDPLGTFWASDHPWVKNAKSADMTLAQLRKHVEAQGVPPQKWVEDVTKGSTFRAEAA